MESEKGTLGFCTYSCVILTAKLHPDVLAQEVLAKKRKPFILNKTVIQLRYIINTVQHSFQSEKVNQRCAVWMWIRVF